MIRDREGTTSEDGVKGVWMDLLERAQVWEYPCSTRMPDRWGDTCSAGGSQPLPLSAHTAHGRSPSRSVMAIPHGLDDLAHPQPRLLPRLPLSLRPAAETNQSHATRPRDPPAPWEHSGSVGPHWSKGSSRGSFSFPAHQVSTRSAIRRLTERVLFHTEPLTKEGQPGAATAGLPSRTPCPSSGWQRMLEWAS